MKYLITYRCERFTRKAIWGYEIAADPFEWLLSTQKHEAEIYFIINALPITETQAAQYDGALRGM
jgi:hypothetical protein